MAFESLTEREKKVLACLISHYVKSADPVGSRAIANKYRLGISPATIRNTMQDLEEMGLVKQPHTSAGRIPTDAGYRLFVDTLLRQEALTEQEKQVIKAGLTGKGGIDAILEQTSRVLAEISAHLGISISPQLDNSILTRIELIEMSKGKVLVVMAFKTGLARTILVEVDASISHFELEKMSQVLNEKLSGLTLGILRTTIQERLADSGGNPRLIRLFVDDDSEIWNNLEANQIHVGGTENILSLPEFSDRHNLQNLIKAIDKRSGLINLFQGIGDEDGGIVITIGAENKTKEIQSCSVVSATYNAGTTRGMIGVIGPTRMPYAKLVSLVKYAARQLSRVLKGED